MSFSEFPTGDILTEQEHSILGSTSPTKGNPHIPMKARRAKAAIEETQARRKKIGWVDGGIILAVVLGRPDLGIKLQDLDPETGETIADPIVGVRDAEAGTYVESTELTIKLFSIFEEQGIELHLREGNSQTVEQSGSSKERPV